MIERGVIAVDGAPGAGKTTFVERLLEASEAWLQAVRCHREPRLREPEESRPSRHAELARYRAAGADGVTLYRFPEEDGEAFFCSDFMMDPSHVVLEGDRPIPHVDLEVAIASAPASRRRVLRRVKRDPARERREMITRAGVLLQSDEGTAELVGEMLGPLLGAFVRDRPDLLESMRGEMAANLERLSSAGPSPEATAFRWTIEPPYRGIERAQLVVFNVRSEGERQAAERGREDVLRMRKDEEVFSDVIGMSGSRVPITVVVANLADRGDAELKKALRRVERVLR